MTKNPIDPLTQALQLQQAGNLDASEALFIRILNVAPTNQVALYSLALMALNGKRTEKALEYAKQGTSTNPDFAPLWFIQGSIHQALFQLDNALHDYDVALRINPKYLEVLINSGALLRDMHRHQEAMVKFKGALDVDPNYEIALGNYGILLTEFKMGAEAVSIFQRLLSINPNYPFGLGLLTYERMHLCDWTDIDSVTHQITQGIREGKKTSKTLGYMALSDSAEDHYQCARIFANAHFPHQHEPLWKGEIYQHQRIKIAYVSPDFREHPVGHLMAGVIEKHDKTKFEVILISIGIDDQSSLRSRFIQTADHFINAKEMSTLQIAQLMRQMEVDIAIDLAGYTSDSKTDIFKHRPAPVQANYLGYPGTMAMDCYDYIIADPIVLPPEDVNFYSEKPAYLDYCYLPIASGIEVGIPKSRQEYGLPEDGFVFCAFSHDYKIHPSIFSIWMRLLIENPKSVLWLVSRQEATINNLRYHALSSGVNPDRLIFASRVPDIKDHLARYKVANLFLDTWPYNAHTTAADALLAGLPVITYKGHSFPSRVASSLMTALGLGNLVANTYEEYFQIANRLANDPSYLNESKARISPEALSNHPFLGASFTQRLEKLFSEISISDIQQAPNNLAVHEYQEALLHFQKSQYTVSEIHLRECLKIDPTHANALELLNKVKHKFAISNGFILTEKKSLPDKNRFLLIKAWGFGFWSDMHHVMTQLLLAELTQRKPIILWGNNSLFADGETNAFPHYFDTTYFFSLDNVPINSSIYPPKWNAMNLFNEDICKWTGKDSRLSAQYYFDREEDLLVSDFYSPLDTMLHWIDPSSSYYGLTEDEIFSLLFKKYLTPSEHISKLVDDFYQSNMANQNWVAVHMRGSDKVSESPHLDLVNQQYLVFIDRILELNPNLRIFLMTDSDSILKSMTDKYGEKILTKQAHRSNSNVGIHLSGHSGHSIGEEVLVESYLATKCDYFIGNRESNVSLGVFSLKDWKQGFVFMLGVRSSRGSNSFIFKHPTKL
jgi:predicted O-linked N-acetylglucosamine transferase (SPINDLY family)